MAAENKTVPTNYYSVREHKFIKSVPEKTEKSKERIYENKTYHYEEYNSISGRIISFMIWDEPLKDASKPPLKMLAVNLWDAEAKVRECIQMYFNGNGAYTLFNRLFKIDYTKDVRIQMRKTEKKKNGKPTGEYKDNTCVYQIDENGNEFLIPAQFSKENNESEFGALPPAEQVGTEKNPSWNFAKQQEFIENIFAQFNERLRSLNNNENVVNKNLVENSQETKETESDTSHRDDFDAIAAEQKAAIEERQKAETEKPKGRKK